MAGLASGGARMGMGKLSILAILFIITRLISSSPIPHGLLSVDIASRLRVDREAIRMASTDFGKLVGLSPASVLYPESVDDIATLLHLSYNSSEPFGVAARGHGHSIRGQAMAHNGVVVHMPSLNSYAGGDGIRVSWSPALGFYADVGGEQLWIHVLHRTLEHGLAPLSWTDYLYLTVGGTLSNAGISGQTFLHGPQIANVFEMDVVTGKGELVTCSKHINSELFYAVLGGLGQFGIITRARIALSKARNRVKWVRLLYRDFSDFTGDQERLISVKGLDYLEGALIMRHSPPNNWRSSFFSPSDQSRIASLLANHGIIYSLEAVKYYDDATAYSVDEELGLLLQNLNFVADMKFEKDVSLVDFLNRVRSGELKLRSVGKWDVPHPWLNLFVPKSRIMDFNARVFINIVYEQGKPTGPILVYPTHRNKWDDRMSAVTPEEDIFYVVGFLHSSSGGEWEGLDDQNGEILEVCDEAGIEAKQYLPHYTTQKEWKRHWGSKWHIFQERKAQFDPKMILSPGQRIFN